MIFLQTIFPNKTLLDSQTEVRSSTVIFIQLYLEQHPPTHIRIPPLRCPEFLKKIKKAIWKDVDKWSRRKLSSWASTMVQILSKKIRMIKFYKDGKGTFYKSINIIRELLVIKIFQHRISLELLCQALTCRQWTWLEMLC